VGFGTVGRVLEPATQGASLAAVTDPRIAAAGAAGLEDRGRRILDFEREAWKLTVSKERAIRETFGVSATRYHQLLRRVLERPEALAYDPMLVRRLQRVREARRRRRVADRLGVRM
jgi:Protein of unknown function (DUF3263)